MDLNERIMWLLFGMAIGFILGYIVRSLRDIQGDVGKIKNLMTKRQNESKEGGFVRNPIILNLVLLFVIALTAYAAISTQKVNNDFKASQEEREQDIHCNADFLGQTIKALNQRTASVQRQSAVNVRLHRAQFEFFTTILRQPEDDLIKFDAFRTYIEAQRRFLKINRKLRKAHFKPYPTAEGLSRCLNR